MKVKNKNITYPLLDKLTKKDLIKVIGNIADYIQTESEWISQGLDKNSALILFNVGKECKQHCVNTNWELPQIADNRPLIDQIKGLLDVE